MLQTWALSVFLLLGLSYILRFASRRVSLYRFGRRHGCADPYTVPNPFPYTGSSFLSAFQSVNAAGALIPYTRDLLLRGPGRTTRAVVLGKPWIMTSHPENIRSMHSLGGKSLVSVAPIRTPLAGWLGEGIFVSSGPYWKMSRQLFKPMFSRIPASDLGRFEVHVERFLEGLPGDGVKVDLQVMLKRMYLDVATDVMFGREFGAQSRREDAEVDVEGFEKAFGAAMMGSARAIRSSSLTFWLFRRRDRQWEANTARVHDVFDKFIDMRLQRDVKGGREKEPGNSMLDHLMEQSTDKHFLRSQLLNVFIGARDTASIGISNVFFHLARRPDIWKKLRIEVDAIGSQPVTYELLKSLSYVQAVIHESLRLLSPLSRAIRIATADFVLPRGGGAHGQQPVLVPKGARVESNMTGLHRDPGVWGADADEFVPERWETAQTGIWEYLPFSGGERMCPAQQLMLTQYAYILVRFLQTFKTMENKDETERFVSEVAFSLHSRNGVQVAVYRS